MAAHLHCSQLRWHPAEVVVPSGQDEFDVLPHCSNAGTWFASISCCSAASCQHVQQCMQWPQHAVAHSSAMSPKHLCARSHAASEAAGSLVIMISLHLKPECTST